MRSVAEAELALRGRKPREAKGLAEPFGLVLSRIAGGVRDALSWSGPSPREKTLGEDKRSLTRLARLGEPGP